MNIRLALVIAVSIVLADSTISFKLESALKDPRQVAARLALEDRTNPILTETALGIHITLGGREPRVINNAVADCEAFAYPVGGGQYQNNEDVVFLVESENREARQLVFTTFSTEANFDFVSVFTWSNNQFVLHSRYSGSTLPAPITSPNGRFLVSFTSDYSVTRTGFTFILLRPQTVAIKDPSAAAKRFAAEDLSAPVLTESASGFQITLGDRQPHVVSTIDEDCGQLAYPVGGGHYSNNEDVVFLINPQTRGPRQIAFTSFRTELNYDYVSVFVWENNQFKLVGRYSGSSLPQVITAPEGRVLISFTSDYSITNTGFNLVYYKNPATVLHK